MLAILFAKNKKMRFWSLSFLPAASVQVVVPFLKLCSVGKVSNTSFQTVSQAYQNACKLKANLVIEHCHARMQSYH